CRLGRQVNKFSAAALSDEAAELLHLPGKPAGVVIREALFSSLRTSSPAGQARGGREDTTHAYLGLHRSRHRRRRQLGPVSPRKARTARARDRSLSLRTRSRQLPRSNPPHSSGLLRTS